nr:adenylate/guanylate cyclase domain-containing protein [Nitrospirota bacterium]
MARLTTVSAVLLRGVLVAVAVLAMARMEGLERWGLNALFHLRGTEPPQAPIVIVSIGEDSFDELDLAWPWPRSLHAQFLETIGRGHPLAVGFDILFAEPSSRGPDDDQAFAEALQTAGNATLAAALTEVREASYSKQDLNPPIRTLREKAQGYGVVNFVIDDDAFVRWADLTHSHQDVAVASFDQELYRTAVQAGMPAQPLGQARFLINYRGGPKTFSTIPYYRVLNGEVSPDTFRGKIVLVGATSPVLHDLHPTPFAPHGDMPGIEVHANVLETLIQGLALQPMPEPVKLLLVLLGATAAVTATQRLNPLPALGTLALLAAAYEWATFWAFAKARLVLPVTTVPLALGLGFAATVAENFVQEQRKRALLMTLFSSHVSAEVAQAIWKQRDQFMDGGRPRPQELTATILFTDLKGYTSVSEKMAPKDLLDWVNGFLDRMSTLVSQHGGVVDDYAGDAIKADFGVPVARTTEAEIRRDAIHAIACALAMEQELQRLNAQYHTQGLPLVGMRIGIATGPVVAGSIGSAKRLKYTTIGDTVNVASRLESFDKDQFDPAKTPCRILINDATQRLIEGQFCTAKLAELSLKGKTATITVYRVEGGA